MATKPAILGGASHAPLAAELDDQRQRADRPNQSPGRYRNEANAVARAIPRQLTQSRVVMAPVPASRLLVVVRLSSERVRQAVRQDCSAKKQASPPALLVVIQLESVLKTVGHARSAAVAESAIPPEEAWGSRESAWASCLGVGGFGTCGVVGEGGAA
jgi:hypothetical protein